LNFFIISKIFGIATIKEVNSNTPSPLLGINSFFVAQKILFSSTLYLVVLQE
jgi:hypothetical protein